MSMSRRVGNHAEKDYTPVIDSWLRWAGRPWNRTSLTVYLRATQRAEGKDREIVSLDLQVTTGSRQAKRREHAAALSTMLLSNARYSRFPQPWDSVINLNMMRKRAENFCQSQQSTDIMAEAINYSGCSIWPFNKGVQSIGGRIKTNTELNSWT